MGGGWESRKCAETMKWKEGGAIGLRKKRKVKKETPAIDVRMYVCWSG